MKQKTIPNIPVRPETHATFARIKAVHPGTTYADLMHVAAKLLTEAGKTRRDAMLRGGR